MMTEQQFEKFLDLQFAQLVVLQGIFSCMQASGTASGGRIGTMNFKDTKKVLDSAAETRKSS